MRIGKYYFYFQVYKYLKGTGGIVKIAGEELRDVEREK